MSNSIELISADYNINTDLTFPKDLKVIDLVKLSRNFKIDTTTKQELDQDGNQIKKYFTPNSTLNFTQVRYSKKDKTDAEEVYNRPPIGPITPGFGCLFCGNTYPEYHSTDCMNPNAVSLRLTFKGLMEIIANVDKNTRIENINELRRNEQSLQTFINEHFDIPNPPDDEQSDLSYTDVVVVKGTEKLPYKTAKSAFNNTVFITYTNEPNTDITKLERSTNIRIYPSGFIDIKGAPLNQTELTNMLNELLTRMKKTGAIDISKFNVLLTSNKLPLRNDFTILPDKSYYTVIRTQFYFFGEKQDTLIIDLEKLNDTYIENFKNSNDLILNNTKLTTDTISRTGNKVKESLIYKYSVPDIGKLTLQISRFGTFQITVSNDLPVELNESMVVMKKLQAQFLNLDSTLFTEQSLETKVPIYDKTITTVSGLVPPKSRSQKQGTETCAKNQAGVPIRPEPYTWSGICPMDGYYVPPIGKQGGDIRVSIDGKLEQLYFPCCKKLTNKDRQEYQKLLLDGFPLIERQGRQYGIFNSHDALSGVFNDDIKPGQVINVKTPESTWENPSWIKVKILSQNKGKPISYSGINLNTNEKINFPRTDIERATRKFKGLNDLNKNELINILKQSNAISSTRLTSISQNLDNSIELKKLNKYTIVKEFINNKYLVGGVPADADLVYLVINQSGRQLLLDSNNKLVKETNYNLKNKQFSGTIVGFYDSQYFYAIFVLDKFKSIKLGAVFDDPKVQSVPFYENIIRESHLLLKNEPDTRLLFIQDTETPDTIYYFYRNSIPETLTVQLIEGDKSSYILGYKDKAFNDKPIYIDLLPKQLKLRPEVGDYIKVKILINNKTGKVMPNRPFSYISNSNDIYMNHNDVKSKFLETFNPITTEDFDDDQEWEFVKKSLYFQNGRLVIE